jgi:hypothetical protein
VLFLRRSSRSFFLISLTVSSPSSSHLTDAELEDDRDIPDAVDGGRSEDELEMVDEGRREVSKLRLMVELTEVRLTVLVGGRSSLASVVDEVAVETAERTVPKRREDGKAETENTLLLANGLGDIVLWRNLERHLGMPASLIDPASKLLVDILIVPILRLLLLWRPSSLQPSSFLLFFDFSFL